MRALLIALALAAAVTGCADRGVYYRDCAEAKAAGVAPLERGDDGYRAELDRDGNGVACEQ